MIVDLQKLNMFIVERDLQKKAVAEALKVSPSQLSYMLSKGYYFVLTEVESEAELRTGNHTIVRLYNDFII